MTARVNLVRAGEAPRYDPPGHTNVAASRLQGLEAGGPRGFWVGRSSYPPGARAELGPTAGDTVYVLLAGRLVVSVETADGPNDELTLQSGDSLFLAEGTRRSVVNRDSTEALLLVVLQPGGGGQ